MNIRKTALWFFVNGIIVYLAYLALVDGHGGITNILKFLLILNFIFVLLMIIPTKASKNLKRSVPDWFNLLYSIMFASFLVYYGWFFFAGIEILTTFLQVGIFGRAEQEAKDNASRR